MTHSTGRAIPLPTKSRYYPNTQQNTDSAIPCFSWTTDSQEQILLGLDSDTFYIYHVAAVMVDNLRRLLLGINLSDKAIMDFDFPGVGFPV